MSEVRYNVIVVGTALEGFELPQVIDEFAKLFHLGEAKAEQVFSSGNVVIKKNVTETTAHKFLKALEGIGAKAHILPLQQHPANAAESESGTALESPSEPVKQIEIEPSRASVVNLSKPSEGTQSNNTDTGTSDTVGSASVSVPPAGEPVNENSSVDEQAQTSVLEFNFLGKGGEYFKVWIVNLLLTIVTLGIYSAWAKVRNTQYFYGHTEIAGSRFAYLANPITILIGRIIAVVVFLIYSVIAEVAPLLGGILTLLLIIAIPWIVVRSLRFNARMSAWRNIRFGFDGKMGGAAIAFILWPIVGMISMGLAIPYVIYKQNEYIINHSRYGTARFELNPCAWPYYVIYFKAFGILLVAGIIFGLLSTELPALGGLVMVLVYFYLFAFIAVQSANLIYNNTSFEQGSFEFHSFWETLSYLKLIFINSLLILLTLGLFFPFAMVRVARYKAEHMELISHAGLDQFVAGQEEKINALGEEFGEVFDMEVGV